MINVLLNIDMAAVDWSRAQFALTAIYHWLFVPLTLGLAVIMGIAETIWYRTKDEFWKESAKFWQRLFGVNFAIGVATGIVLEFEFGTNWSNYSWFVGDIFGAPLAVEGIVAFFMESTFVAVMFFGWNKVSRGFHLASTWLTGLGATISAWWILVANAWMQYPVGCEFNPDTMRNEMTSFAEVALSPMAVNKFFHTVTSSWIIGALFVSAVCCWYLLKKRHERLAISSMKIAAIVGLVASLLAMHTGDGSAYQVGQKQPMKLAAMEALYKGGESQALTAIALVNPFEQPDYDNVDEPEMKIAMPYALSFLATHDVNGYVPGVRDILDGGYIQPDGTVALSLEEKMALGRKAADDLREYRLLTEKVEKTDADATRAEVLKGQIKENMPYFGYSYVNEREQVVPFIPVCFYSFRVMVGLGVLFMLFFIVALYLTYRKDITRYRWLHIVGICLLPLGYIASEAGWIVAEMGRQPWTIQDMLPTWAGVSGIGSGSVMLTFFVFLVLFTVLLSVEINIMLKQIKKGPEL
ncbi:MAG: cytochrome ubiquinol oxidase subunit I [Prevotella sp.]|nr:cytochrome ubiquinol oxidase subunit I [Prevotella sp.]